MIEIGYFVLISFLVYFLSLILEIRRIEPNELQSNILIVIAHPGILILRNVLKNVDDECMFFGPSITNLIQRNHPENVYLVCLTNGILKIFMVILCQEITTDWEKYEKRSWCSLVSLWGSVLIVLSCFNLANFIDVFIIQNQY